MKTNKQEQASQQSASVSSEAIQGYLKSMRGYAKTSVRNICLGGKWASEPKNAGLLQHPEVVRFQHNLDMAFKNLTDALEKELATSQPPQTDELAKALAGMDKTTQALVIKALAGVKK